MNIQTFRRAYLLPFLIVALCALYLFGLYRGYTFLKYREKIYCGIVVNKIESVTQHKHSSSPNFILSINFDELGVCDQSVSASTFLSARNGNRLCYERRVYSTWSNTIFGFFGLLCWLLLLISIIFHIILLIRWVFVGKFYE